MRITRVKAGAHYTCRHRQDTNRHLTNKLLLNTTTMHIFTLYVTSTDYHWHAEQYPSQECFGMSVHLWTVRTCFYVSSRFCTYFCESGSVCMRFYVFVLVCMCLYVFSLVSTFLCVFVRVWKFLCVSVKVCKFLHVSVRVCTRLHVSVRLDASPCLTVWTRYRPPTLHISCFSALTLVKINGEN